MIVKPSRLGFLRRVSSDGDGHRLWIAALGAFDMRSPRDFLTEAELWQTAAPALGTTLLDAGMPKSRAEVLMAGDACAPAPGRTFTKKPRDDPQATGEKFLVTAVVFEVTQAPMDIHFDIDGEVIQTEFRNELRCIAFDGDMATETESVFRGRGQCSSSRWA